MEKNPENCEKYLLGIFSQKTLRVMKATLILLMLVVFQMSAKHTYAQMTKISLNLEDTKIEDALLKIEENSEFFFLYSPKLIDVEKLISLNVEDVSIKDVLVSMFGSEVSIGIYDRQIILTPNQGKKLIPEFEQQKVTGVVTDKEGVPLPGVYVVVPGTTFGSMTDSQGRYEIVIPPGSKILTFTFIGMQSQEVLIDGQSKIDVVLLESTVSMDEVVVIGYGTARREDLTSAITTVQTELIENRPVLRLSTSLQGLTPGVYIRQQTGRPGYSASTIDIRGASMGTFSSNPPLYIIDGIVDNINNINPDDVDKISILKDAAAASIYGSRSTGGVILITTKRGSAGIPVINFSSLVGIQKRPTGDYSLINTAEWMRANNEAARLDGSPDIYSAEAIAKYENSTDPQLPVKSQWMDWFPETALQQKYNLSIKGGTEKLNIYGSTGYDRQGGFLPNDDYGRMSFLLNVNYVPVKKLEIKTTVSYLKEDITRPLLVNDIIRNTFCTPPTTPFYLPNGDYNNVTIWGYNPAYRVKEEGNTLYDSDLLRMGVTFSYEIFEGLKLNLASSTNLNYYTYNYLYKKIPYRNNDGEIYKYNRADPIVEETWTKGAYFNNQILLEYNKRLEKHFFNVVGGFTSEDERTDFIRSRATGFPNNEIRQVSGTTATGDKKETTTSAEDWAIASFIGRLIYSYKDKYLFETSFRYDGSSRFSPRQRWGFFPSASLGWRITEENFMKDLTPISNLKLRLSYGELGNQGSTLYPFAERISTTGTAAFGNGMVATAVIGSPVYLGLTWEKKRTGNFGVDFGFFNNRLSGSFDYFYDRTSNIIGRPVVPTTFGASAPIQNTYTIDNKGYEIDLRWNDQVGKLNYFISFSFSDFRDKIISLGGIGTTDERFGEGLVQISTNTYLQEGKPRNLFYLYRTNGLFVDQEELDNHAFISNLTRPGDICFIDVTEDGKITVADMVPDNKGTTPHYFFGLNLGLEFMNFDLSAIINGIGERWDYRNNGGVYLTGVRPTLAIIKSNYDNRWTEENPDKWADQPRLTQNNWIANTYSTLFTGPAEYHLRNFGYLRVKNLQLGYTIPTNMTTKIKINKLRVFLAVENILTFTPGYTEPIDPESVMNYTAEGSAFFGQPEIYNFGLSVTF